MAAANAPSIRYWQGQRGFTVLYRRADSKLLDAIRSYQATIRQHAPGWLTRLEAGTSSGALQLHVFPVEDALTAVRLNTYG
jgi:hypothetical protein